MTAGTGSAGDTHLALTGRRLRLGRVALLLAVAMLIACWGVWRWEYSADDARFFRTYSSTTPDGESAVRWGTVFGDFVGPWQGNTWMPTYRPMVTLTLALDFAVFGFNAGASAVLNLLSCWLAAVALYALAVRVLPDPRGALPAALLLALTPLAHESIAWAVGRCGLTVLLGVLSGLVFVRAYAAGRSGLALHGMALLLVVLNMMTMESAVPWCLFPPLCVLLHHNAHPELPRPRRRRLLFLVLPYAVAMAGYFLLRRIFVGVIAGEWLQHIIPQDPLEFLAVAAGRLRECLVPLDHTWLGSRPEAWTEDALVWIWVLFCLAPLLLGLRVLLDFRSPRSRRASWIALGLLLSFWVFSRLPNLNLSVGFDLNAARGAFYCYAPVALAVGLIVSGTARGRLLIFAVAVAFGLNLKHRNQQRLLWASRGREARFLLYEEARRSGRMAADDRAVPMAYMSSIQGEAGAPAYHASGEISYALFPPLVPARVLGVSLHSFIDPGAKRHHLVQAAWIGKACGGIQSLLLVKDEVKLLPTDPDVFLRGQLLPEGGLAPRLVDTGGSYPELELSDSWREHALNGAAQPVVILATGTKHAIAPLPPGGGWPELARLRIEDWAFQSGVGGAIACFVETRLDPEDPASARARSKVLFGRILRRLAR
ncbi:MAG: hypothetical protein ACE5F1_07440 [Planctomycetota bacterium]